MASTGQDLAGAAGYLRAVASATALSDGGQWAPAAAAWERVVAQNPVRGGHWERLTEAALAMSDFRAALRAYERVRELGAWGGRAVATVFPGEVSYRVACCHAGLGDRDRALDALGRAMAEGFRDLDRPRADPCWAGLRADDAVRELLGTPGPGALSRVEGWRADIWFLAREVKRRAVAPFRAAGEPDFDDRVSRLAQAVPGLTDAQIIAGLLRLLVPLRDGHAFVAPPADRPDLNRVLPVKFYLFAEGLFVTAAAPQYRSLLGAQVIRVGDHAVQDVLAAVEPIISRDNDQQLAWLGPEVLPWSPMLHALGLTGDPDAVTLTVRFADQATGSVTVGATAAPVPRPYPTVAPSAAPARPGVRGWISLADTRPGPLPLYLRHWDRLYWFGYLPARDLVYCQLNGLADDPRESLAAFCDRLFAGLDRHAASTLVIDLRWNGGGNTLLAQPLLHHLIGCARIGHPGGLFVIIGRGTFSAAQNTATAIERETNAIFVGEPSGSRPNFTGETSQFELPWSRVIANVSDLYWQTSWPVDDRPWIAPELYTPPTFAACWQNRDPAMEAILGCHRQVPAGLPRR